MNFDNKIEVVSYDTLNNLVELKNSGTYSITNVYYSYIDLVEDTVYYYNVQFDSILSNEIVSGNLKVMVKLEYSDYLDMRYGEEYFTPSLIDMMKKEGFKDSESVVFSNYWKEIFFTEKEAMIYSSKFYKKNQKDTLLHL